jgi:hypothetical protein
MVETRSVVEQLMRNGWTVIEFLTRIATPEEDKYVVIQATNGFTYTGKFFRYDEEKGSITVVYEKGGKQILADIFISGICSIQLSTKREIEEIRDKKRGTL